MGRDVNLDEAMESIGIKVVHIESEEDIPGALDELFGVEVPKGLVDEDFTPICQCCAEPITTPSECLMDGFRLGFPIHKVCSANVDRFLANWKLHFGVEYGN